MVAAAVMRTDPMCCAVQYKTEEFLAKRVEALVRAPGCKCRSVRMWNCALGLMVV